MTTVVVKPRSRGEERIRSADPADKPLVGPNLLKPPDAMRAFQAAPLAGRVKRVAIPDPARLDDEALAGHCKRFVKTNYHPASTARMGADGAPLAVVDARMRVHGIKGFRVADMSAVADINAGNTNAPA